VHPWHPYYYSYGYSIAYLPTWILVVLVLLPVFTREGSFIDAARRHQARLPIGDTQSTSLMQLPGKGILMGFILGMVALLVPFFAYVYDWGAGSSTMMLLSTSWTGSLRFSGDNSFFELTPLPFASILSPTFFIIPLFFVFNLGFAYSVLLYLQSRASKMRTALYGALGVAVPLAFFSVSSMMTGVIPGYTMQYIPLPVQQIVGLLMMLFVKQTRQDERIWDDSEDKMWFDEEGREERRTPDPTPKVTIPVTYLLRSRIRGFRKGSKKRIVVTDPHEAEWAHDEEIWT
jgi:hypothetical protein